MTLSLSDLLRRLDALETPRRRGRDGPGDRNSAIPLAGVRALAKACGPDHALALALWNTGETAPRLLATLLARPGQCTADDLDAMVRQIEDAKLLDWFVVHLARRSRHGKMLGPIWRDAEALVGRAGWLLAVDRILKDDPALDAAGLLDRIEQEMGTAHPDKQWVMNRCLAEIGIHRPALRSRAIAIGETLGVLIDYPVSPGCTSPYAPVWIAEMVRRRKG